jgi:hypothetical protein
MPQENHQRLSSIFDRRRQRERERERAIEAAAAEVPLAAFPLRSSMMNDVEMGPQLDCIHAAAAASPSNLLQCWM